MLQVLGENYTLDDPEDSHIERASRLFIAEARYACAEALVSTSAKWHGDGVCAVCGGGQVSH